MKGKLKLEADIPKVILLGHYKINGQILVLPIQGEGNSNLTLGKFIFLRDYKIPVVFNDFF